MGMSSIILVWGKLYLIRENVDEVVEIKISA